jgi:sialidase-1
MSMNRRTALKSISTVAMLPTVMSTLNAAARTTNTAPGFELIDLQTFSQPNDRYYGWATVARRSNGELLVVASGGREQHVCPFGRVDLIQSFDNGDSWTFARTISDGPIDDRDAGILETAKGTLLVTTFTSLAYERALEKAVATADSDNPSMPPEQLLRWQAAHGRLREGQHKAQLGCWMLRSEDGGLTWSTPYRCP